MIVVDMTAANGYILVTFGVTLIFDKVFKAAL
jgi:hypothetical protein